MTQPFDARPGEEIHILVAEDDLVTRMVLKKMLEKVGYRADFVNDGQQAIDALKQGEYDLVLMDCFMPGLDGFDATRALRRSTSGELDPNVPVIAMTGLTSASDRQRCMDAGMNDHVGKPVKTDELVAAIERNLGAVPLEAGATSEQTSAAWDGVFLDTLIEKFTADIPQVVESLQHAVVDHDLAGLESIGHRLRGASDILEIRNLSTRSHALEQAGKAGDLEQAGRLASELACELQKMAEMLKS